MVQGGLPEGSSILLQGPPGQEKLRFALTFLAEGLKGGGSGLVVSSSQSPDAVLAELRELGVNLDAVTKENRLRVVDWYSWSEEPVEDVEERGAVVRSSIDLTNLDVALSRAIAGLVGDSPRRAVIEILSPATNVYEVTQVYAFAQSAKRKFDRSRFTSLVLLEKDMHSTPELTTLHQPFDGVIEIERSRSGHRFVRKIGVLHMKDTAPDASFRIPEVTEAGMKVGREASKPAAPVPSHGGGVLESQDERARRLHLIMQIASERLKLNPSDPDALFALAAAQATLDDAAGGVQTLDRLAALDPNYPGLWVLKTKLHARLGQTDLAKESRVRAAKEEVEADLPAGPTVPCPMCEAPVAPGATMCENCGIRFAPARTLEDELDDLGHAAIQEMVQEELAAEPKPEVKPPTPLIPKPTEKAPSKPSPTKGMTNGLVLQRGAPRWTGRTNGLKGRTNGLRGRTKGLTNGLGRTNGLTNGLGGARPAGFHSSGLRGAMRNAGWKLYLVPLVSVALLLMPLFLVPEYLGPTHPIQIDGNFTDWASAALFTQIQAPGLNANVDLVRFGTLDNGPYLAFYAEVRGVAFEGGGVPPQYDTLRLFLDVDRDADTGYAVAGIGADRLVEISGWGNHVNSTTLSEWDVNRPDFDWNGWIKSASIAAAVVGTQIEFEIDWSLLLPQKAPIFVYAHFQSYDQSFDESDYVVSTEGPIVLAKATAVVPEIIQGTDVSLLRLDLTAVGMPATFSSVRVTITGTATLSSVSAIRIVDGIGTVLQEQMPTSGNVTFQFAPRTLSTCQTESLTIRGDFVGSSGDTFGVSPASPQAIPLASGIATVRLQPSPRAVGYIGVIPASYRVDGAFSDWGNVTTDPLDPGRRADIDLRGYEFARDPSGLYVYMQVAGRILQGAIVPQANALAAAMPSGTSNVDSDRDTVPDSFDPMPYDFNNDGIQDTLTNHDYDGDGISDYPFGSDYYLNTTIPSNFPPPYANQPVSLYIGPTVRPALYGEDVARVFLDADDNPATGFRINILGADYLLEF